MSRLPGAENWLEDEVRHRIAFLDSLADNTPKLVAEMARASGYQNADLLAERPTDAIHSLVEAAELAFAIEDTGLGLKLCEKIADLLSEGAPSLTPMQVVLAATAGAIAGVIDVALHPRAIVIRREGEIIAVAGLLFPSSRYNLTLLRRAAYAVAASNNFEFAPAIGDRDEQPGAIWDRFLTTPEGRMFKPIRGTLYPGRSVLERLSTDLELAYDDQLAAQRQDWTNWQRFIARGGLIDWRLLALETGIVGRSVEMPLVERVTAGGAFLGNTARSIVQWRRAQRLR